MKVYNCETGEVVNGHRIGSDDSGRALYAAASGWEPCDPYECDEDGNWIDTGRVLALAEDGGRSWADWDATVNLMDADLREQIHGELAPCSAADFLAAYESAHEQKFGEKFKVS